MTAALTTMRIARADIGHVFDRIRATVPHYVDDRPMMADIEAVTEPVRTSGANG